MLQQKKTKYSHYSAFMLSSENASWSQRLSGSPETSRWIWAVKGHIRMNDSEAVMSEGVPNRLSVLFCLQTKVMTIDGFSLCCPNIKTLSLMNTLYNMMTVFVRKEEVKIQRIHVDRRARTEATADCACCPSGGAPFFHRHSHLIQRTNWINRTIHWLHCSVSLTIAFLVM